MNKNSFSVFVKKLDEPKLVYCRQCSDCPLKLSGNVNMECYHYHKGICLVESANRGSFSVATIGKAFGVTKQMISHTEKKALRKLRKLLSPETREELHDGMEALAEVDDGPCSPMFPDVSRA